MKFKALILLFSLIYSFSWSQINKSVATKISVGAAQVSDYLPQLKGKNVALVVNQTSVVGKINLLDFLLDKKIKVIKLFVPEHGFRGKADAGATIENEIDESTKVPIISLYRKEKQPTAEELKDIDIVVYDLQDVGVRFYTYISTLEYVMSACIENNKELIILDRPNPNGFYVDGPVLELKNQSFVGRQPIPVVYGMTVGEYAKMLIGENWIPNAASLKMTVISCKNYTHKTLYELPIPPSPNLKNSQAIYLYPSLCFFEGTVLSVGRGTETPFQQWGHPKFKDLLPETFTPKANLGSSKPLLEGQVCYGRKIVGNAEEILKLIDGKLQLKWLIEAYRTFPEQSTFFNDFFNKLSGNNVLKTQIINGLPERKIRASWQPKLKEFKKIRKKYLLYEDF